MLKTDGYAPVIRLFLSMLVEEEETIRVAYEQGKIVTVKLKCNGKDKRVLPIRIEIVS